ncbi:hypothetical protein E4T56_gene11771 [Termitomyces sp. T112]|nr:hypothetical protein E4T56_gene11771 [Termitomyces sp. T112]
MIDCTRPTWIQLRDIFNPFASMLSLESLRFNMTGEFLRITLSFQFPWNRLKSLSIQAYQRVQDGDLTEVMILTTIEKCTSLTHLEIRHPVYLSSNQPLIGPCYPINFPRIQSLTLNREIPVCLLLTLPPTIRRLRIDTTLFHLDANLEPVPSSFADQLAPIVAPSLTSLVVCTGPDVWKRCDIALAQTKTELLSIKGFRKCRIVRVRAPKPQPQPQALTRQLARRPRLCRRRFSIPAARTNQANDNFTILD